MKEYIGKALIEEGDGTEIVDTLKPLLSPDRN